MNKEMDMSSFQKSLNNLNRMAKSQLFHTPNDSEPGTWAGSGTTPDENEVHIDENGTDYDAVKKSLSQKVAMSKALTPAEVAIVKGTNPYPAIGQKIAKGQKLTAAEAWALKGGRAIFKSEEAKGPKGGADKVSPSDTPAAGDEHGADGVPPTNAGSDAEDKQIEHEKETAKGMPAFLKDSDEDDAEKSFARSAARSAKLGEGLNASPFLAEFASAFGEALKGVESRTKNAIVKSLAPLFGELASTKKSLADVTKLVNAQGEISKALAETVVGIGQHLAGTADASAAASNLPAGGPRSQLRSVPTQGEQVEKSLGGLDIGGNALMKGQMVEAMFEMMKSGQLDSKEVIKFEHTGQMSPGVPQKVQAFLAKARG